MAITGSRGALASVQPVVVMLCDQRTLHVHAATLCRHGQQNLLQTAATAAVVVVCSQLLIVSSCCRMVLQQPQQQMQEQTGELPEGTPSGTTSMVNAYSIPDVQHPASVPQRHLSGLWAYPHNPSCFLPAPFAIAAMVPLTWVSQSSCCLHWIAHGKLWSLSQWTQLSWWVATTLQL